MMEFYNQVITDNSDDESDEDNNINSNVNSNIINSEELIFNPFNTLNKEIEITNVQQILNHVGQTYSTKTFKQTKPKHNHPHFEKGPDWERRWRLLPKSEKL